MVIKSLRQQLTAKPLITAKYLFLRQQNICDFFKVKLQHNQKIVTYNTSKAGSCIAEYILEALSRAHVS